MDRRPFQREDIPSYAGWLALALLSASIVRAFYGQYAFDDSYVGYGNALSLAAGHGFSFNGDDQVLSTSAPLAVPIYAALKTLLGIDIVAAAQAFSALAVTTLAFSAYRVLRAVASRFGSACAAAALLCSPMILLLWSHETLLYLALDSLGLMLLVSRRRYTGAFAIGLGTLLRPEGLLLSVALAFSAFRKVRQRSSYLIAILSFLPFIIWALYAYQHFGSVTSQSFVSKQAQLSYGVDTYWWGIVDGIGYLYVHGEHVSMWAWKLFVLIWLQLLAVTLLTRSWHWQHTAVLAWAAIMTSFYLALQIPFYFWFVPQFAVLTAVLVALPWSGAQSSRLSFLVSYAKVLSFAIFAFNLVYFLRIAIDPTAKFGVSDVVIMPNIQTNAYRRLGEWLRDNTAPADTVTYAEFGQIHFYSQRKIVDYLGFVTPGAAAELARRNAIWTFKRYRPTIVIDSGDFHYFVDPVEQDWFGRAYEHVAIVSYDPQNYHHRFDIYRLVHPTAIPAADERDWAITSVITKRTKDGLRVGFKSRHAGMTEIGLRAGFERPCGTFEVTLRAGERVIAHKKIEGPKSSAFEEVTLAFIPQAASKGSSYQLDITRCAWAAFAPPDLPRMPVYVGDTVRRRGGARDALAVFWR